MKYLVILFAILKLIDVHAQSNQDVIAILKTAFSDSQVEFLQEKSNQLNIMDYNIPLVEKIEVRSETNNFDIKKQDFSVRVSPNTRATRKAHKLYHESVQFMTEMESATQIMRALSLRYHMIIDFVFTNELLLVENEKFAVASDKVKLLKKMISLLSFDIVELIEAEDELYKLQRSIQKIESHAENLRTKLSNLIHSEGISIKKNDIISIDQVYKLLLAQKPISDNGHPEIEVLSAKHYNGIMEHEWEAASSKFSIGFIQAKYGYEEGKNFGNNFSVGLGFNFPLKGSSRLDLNELKIDILNTQSEYLSTKDEITQNKHQHFHRLNSLIEMHQLLKLQIEQGNGDHALKEYSKQRMASPLAILKLKELNVSNNSLLIELEAEIISTYLQYIYHTGDIGAKPYKNFIDKNLSIL